MYCQKCGSLINEELNKCTNCDQPSAVNEQEIFNADNEKDKSKQPDLETKSTKKSFYSKIKGMNILGISIINLFLFTFIIPLFLISLFQLFGIQYMEAIIYVFVPTLLIAIFCIIKGYFILKKDVYSKKRVIISIIISTLCITYSVVLIATFTSQLLTIKSTAVEICEATQNRLKNPDSLTVRDAVFSVGDGKYYVEYSASNSYGGVTRGYVVYKVSTDKLSFFDQEDNQTVLNLMTSIKQYESNRYEGSSYTISSEYISNKMGLK